MGANHVRSDRDFDVWSSLVIIISFHIHPTVWKDIEEDYERLG